MKILLLVFIFLSSFHTNAFAQKKNKKHPVKSGKASSKKKIIIKYGTASYYAKKFDGRRTANGEIYRAAKYSAACNVLPLNTWVKITNLKNEKSVIVKINDRLHAKNKRLVDLSRVAAKELGYLSRGLTKVKLEVLNNFYLGKK
ncbi:MAG: septal ring lytic transglycosylase RlpA family protein [Bacteroidota bacterium]|nr:septal ring lytic transglycosylase RlpA family protein [Bacteroidota bacterium]